MRKRVRNTRIPSHSQNGRYQPIAGVLKILWSKERGAPSIAISLTSMHSRRGNMCHCIATQDAAAEGQNSSLEVRTKQLHTIWAEKRGAHMVVHRTCAFIRTRSRYTGQALQLQDDGGLSPKLLGAWCFVYHPSPLSPAQRIPTAFCWRSFSVASSGRTRVP